MYKSEHRPASTPGMQAWVVGNVPTTAALSCTSISSILLKLWVKQWGEGEKTLNIKILKTSFLRVYLPTLLKAAGKSNISHQVQIGYLVAFKKQTMKAGIITDPPISKGEQHLEEKHQNPHGF